MFAPRSLTSLLPWDLWEMVFEQSRFLQAMDQLKCIGNEINTLMPDVQRYPGLVRGYPEPTAFPVATAVALINLATGHLVDVLELFQEYRDLGETIRDTFGIGMREWEKVLRVHYDIRYHPT